MKKRFLITLDSASSAQNKSFLDYLESKGFGWWHWIDNFWLIDAGETTITAKDIRDKLCETHPNINNFVMEIGSNYETWAAFGPNSEERNMFNWLNDYWNANP